MFWKKKNKDEVEGKLFETPDADRGAFRVYPSKDKPVNIKVGGNQLTACDISAGGISFENKNSFTSRRVRNLEMRLAWRIMHRWRDMISFATSLEINLVGLIPVAVFFTIFLRCCCSSLHSIVR